MYAAAGGASLASRQARQRQRQQKKTQQLQAKLHPPKAPGFVIPAEHGASTPTRSHSRQFHQLPTTYLRAPQSHGRKLSSSYTGQSKLHLLPIEEGGGDTQSVMHMRMHSHAHMHHGGPAVPIMVAPHPNAHHPSHHPYVPLSHGRVSPKLLHRHSGSSGTSFHHSHLPKSATASFPLVSQVEATPPTTPAAAAVGDKAGAEEAAQNRMKQILAPQHDSIIVTPATPIASPGHVAKQQQQPDDLPEAAAEKQPLTAAAPPYDEDEPPHPPSGPLERKCSVYRMRRNDAYDQDSGVAAAGTGSEITSPVGGFLAKKELQFQQQQYEPLILDEPTLIFKGLSNGRKWQPCAYCEEGICVCEHIECAQGRAAWLERGRRCSVQDGQAAMAAAGRRWVKRNRIKDASLGGSSEDEDFLGVLRGPSTFANAFLYVGLGTIALGLVIAFVGTGEKGFKTVELRLIGPSLIGLGLICCILRILFCICPSHCISSGKKARMKNSNKVDADHTTSLLRGENKRVSIARGPSMQKYPIAHKRSNSRMLNDGMEALRQIATTSLFMQNEQKATTNRVVPIIKEPESAEDAPLEMKKLETTLHVSEISDDEEKSEDRKTNRRETDATTTTAATTTTTNVTFSNNISNSNSTSTITTTTTKAARHTTTATQINEKPPLLRSTSKLSRQRIALNQQQQQSQSLSSSSTVKDSTDGDQLQFQETSLIVMPAVTRVNDARPPTATTTTALTATTTTTKHVRLTRTPLTLTSIPPPPTPATGAISRVSSVPLSYDLPSATPHSYVSSASSASATVTATVTSTATSMSSSRSAASALLSSATLKLPERQSRVRGPLAMPLSVLTASGNRYSSPSTASTTATATAATTTASSSSQATTTATGVKTAVSTTTIATSITTKTKTEAASMTTPKTAVLNAVTTCIPGQVMTDEEVKVNTSIMLAATRTTTTTSTTTATTTTRTRSPTTTEKGTTITTATTTKSPTITGQPQQQHLLQLAKTSGLPTTHATPPRLGSFPSGSSRIFKFPTPLSSSASSATTSAASSASSNGRTHVAPFIGTPSNPPPSSSATAAPPSSSSTNKFEPELVLSPAKLGQ